MDPVTIAYIAGALVLKQVSNAVRKKRDKELKRLREEMQKARQEADNDRVLEIQRQEEQLAEEADEEAHIYRSRLIELDYDRWLGSEADKYTVEGWPLKVLPLVMHGGRFGTRIRGCANIAVHSFLVPSNDFIFNTLLHDGVDLGVERDMNDFWGAQTPHAMCYYGAAWNRRGESESADIENLTELVHSRVPSLPVISVRPFFIDGALTLKVWMSGFTPEHIDKIDLTLPDGLFEQPVTPALLRELKKEPGALADIARRLSTCISALLGYFSDIYYWNNYRLPLHLPAVFDELLPEGAVADSMRENLYKFADREFSTVDGKRWVHEHYDDGRRMLEMLRPILPDVKYSLLESNLEAGVRLDDAEGDKSVTEVEFPDPDRDRDIDYAALAQNYTSRRDSLLHIIDKVLALDELSEKEREYFNAVKRRLVSDAFSIVLIGEFQGGKSTTFNALCDGREISPRGSMLKTSAISVTATNLADPAAGEYAEIEWKTPRQLLETIDFVAAMLTPEDLGVEITDGASFDPADHFDFDNPAHIEKVQEIIGRIESGIKSEERIDLQEQLRVGKLIMAFYGDAHIAALRGRGRYTVSDVASFATFPRRWNRRWREPRPAGEIFSPQESVFAFVSGVHVYIHSIELMKLGCSVTDAPGLFASRYDTAVALNAMTGANAVLYLLGGETAMGQSDERALTALASRKELRDKTFFALNRKKTAIVTENILDADADRISEIFNREVEVREYHSLLFLLAQSGRMYLEGTLSDDSVARFMAVAARNGFEADSFDGLWTIIARNIGAATGERALQDIAALDTEAVELCGARSGASSMFADITRRLVREKAYSILVSNGLVRIEKALQGVYKRYKARERRARGILASGQQALNDSVEALAGFNRRIKEIVDDEISPELISEIAALAFKEEVASDSAVSHMTMNLALEIPRKMKFKAQSNAAFGRLIGKIGTKWAQDKSAGSKQKLNDELAPIVRDIITGVLNGRITTWTRLFALGQNEWYKVSVAPRLAKAAGTIEKEWAKVIAANPELDITKFVMPDFTNPARLMTEAMVGQNSSFNLKVEEAMLSAVINRIVVEVASVVCGVLVGVLTDFLLSGGILTLYWALTSAAVGFMAWAAGRTAADPTEHAKSPSDLKKRELKLYYALLNEVESRINDECIRIPTVGILEKVPRDMRTGLVAHYRSQLADVEAELKKMVKDCEGDAARSRQDQIRMAEEARRAYILRIAPLLKELETFSESLCNGK